MVFADVFLKTNDIRNSSDHAQARNDQPGNGLQQCRECRAVRRTVGTSAIRVSVTMLTTMIAMMRDGQDALAVVAVRASVDEGQQRSECQDGKPGMTTVAIHSIFPSSGDLPVERQEFEQEQEVPFRAGNVGCVAGVGFGLAGHADEGGQQDQQRRRWPARRSASLKMLSGQKRSPLLQLAARSVRLIFFLVSFIHGALLSLPLSGSADSPCLMIRYRCTPISASQQRRAASRCGRRRSAAG